MEFQQSETYKNLLKTFAGEARARDMYNFYGEKARDEGYNYLGEIFDLTASNEYAHAREAFKRYLKMVGTTEENLKTASMGEANEYEALYKEFEEMAKSEGFDDIADFYADLREVEESHYKRYNSLYNELKNGTLYKGNADSMWKCMNCGYIYIGEEAPMVCPLCKYPRKYFEPYCINSKEGK